MGDLPYWAFRPEEEEGRRRRLDKSHHTPGGRERHEWTNWDDRDPVGRWCVCSQSHRERPFAGPQHGVMGCAITFTLTTNSTGGESRNGL
ncbi:hypothetical protein CEP51_016327 [Fusarium floridanum]|uniref:Uncharacterized protein n=1 Tax=Fusarium floridanum TaxID=1325733 RepID=A0A428NSE2_9HYPO|nr:hypothetical protein CEP51_016327 [Fusarium floridanum]